MKLVPLVLAAFAVPALAQIQPTSPFIGSEFESFEASASGFNPCVSPRLFNNKADLCTPLGSGTHVTSGWGFACSIQPYDGNKLYGSGGASNGPCEYTFDNPIYSFGGYFGVNNGTADGTANFYDAAGTLLASHPINAPADCSWNWNGWSDATGSGFSRVEIVSNYSVGNYMQMDAMVIDEVQPPPPLELTGTPNQVPLSIGGSQTLSMDVGATFGGKTFQILGSVTGTAPGITYQGVNVPVNFDPYWNFTFLNPNTPILSGSAGQLDPLGKSTSVFSLPPGSDPSLAGLVVNHAGIVLDLVGATITLAHATNPYPVTLVP